MLKPRSKFRTSQFTKNVFFSTEVIPLMKILCALLAVLVIILAAALFYKTDADDEKSTTIVHEKVIVREQARVPLSPESQFDVERAEFLTSGDAQDSSGIDVVQDFAGVDGDYSDYTRSQAVDSGAVTNHKAFVKDMIGPQSNWTGRNYTLPDSSDADQVPNWKGIRGRPVRVNIGSPDQATGDDPSWYADKMAIRY